MTHAETERRQQILDAAARLIQHYGPNKTTMADIAREADVGVGTVYLEFTSKDAIVEELSSRCYAAVLRTMQDAAGDSAARYRDRFRAVFDARCEAFLCLSEQGSHARDLVHCMCPGVRTAHTSFTASEKALLVDLLRAAAQAREFAVNDPETTALTLLRAYSSFAPPWIFSQPADQTRALHAAMHELVLHGLLRRPGGGR
jgi:AcrR family transcriptional regulator